MRKDNLLPASFKGVQFYIFSEALTEEGRKIILHEYVNSNQRFVEDIGQIPSKFSLRAFVSGDDFLERSDSLRRVLNEKGPGRLVMPVFGVHDQTYALSYNVDASQQSVGEIQFGLEFAIGRPAAGPTQTRKKTEDVYVAGDQARANIQNQIAAFWDVPSVVANVIIGQSDIQQSVNQVIDRVSDFVDTDFLSDILFIQRKVSQDLPSIVRNGERIGQYLIGADADNLGVWQNISLGISKSIINQFINSSVAFNSILELAYFGQGQTLTISGIGIRGSNPTQLPSGAILALWPDTTAGRIKRNYNRLVIVNGIRLAALVTAYEIAAAQSYKTQDEIIDVRQRLENIHEELLRDDTIDDDVIQANNDVRFSIENVRLAALDVLEQKAQETFGIVPIEIRGKSGAFVIAYNLYAEEFLEEESLRNRTINLRGLNADKRILSFNGETRVFKRL